MRGVVSSVRETLDQGASANSGWGRRVRLSSGGAARAILPIWGRDPRWIGAIVFVCLLNFWNPVGYVGGGADDDRYIAGALCWIGNGPCLPVNHWEGRWPLIASLAASIEMFGLNRTGVALPSLVASLSCLFLLYALGRRYDPKIGVTSALILAATPAFTIQLMSATVESFELAFVLAGALAITRRKFLIAGIAFAMAFQVRETSLGALVPAAWVMRRDLRGLGLFGVGFGSILLVELLFYYVWTGEALYRRTLSMRHIALPSSELAHVPSGPPIFNTELIKNWKYDLEVHWLLNGFLNLVVSLKTGLLYALAPLLYVIQRRQLHDSERRAVQFLIFSAAFYSVVLIYVLAVDPKPRLMFVPLAALSLASAILIVRTWSAVTLTIVLCTAALISLTMAAQPRQARYERAAEQLEVRFAGLIETAQPGYFGLSRLRDLPPAGSGKPYLLMLKDNYCSVGSKEDPANVTDLPVAAEVRAHPLAVAIGNRWTLCLFRQDAGAAVIRRKPQMGPKVRLSNH